MFVRLSRGSFSAERYQDIAERLREAELTLAPAIRQLRGLIDYYAGIDHVTNTMVRVSVWDKEEHASAMSALPAVIASRAEFETAGVVWEQVATYPVAWWVQSE